MSLDQETLERLYGPKQDGWHPYRLFAYGGESYGMKVLHYPGVQANPIPMGQALEAPFHGYRGLLVQDYHKSLNDQRVRLKWWAVDVDAKDNPSQSLMELFGMAQEALDARRRGGLVFRASKSGTGLHIIGVVDDWQDTTYEDAQLCAKVHAAHAVRLLISCGVMTCVHGLPNLWLWSKGGQQRNLN